MSYEYDEAMRLQEATEAMIRMRSSTMSKRLQDYDLEGTLREAGLVPYTSTDIQRAWADRFLQIHQGDSQKAGAALRLWLRNQQ